MENVKFVLPNDKRYFSKGALLPFPRNYELQINEFPYTYFDWKIFETKESVRLIRCTKVAQLVKSQYSDDYYFDVSEDFDKELSIDFDKTKRKIINIENLDEILMDDFQVMKCHLIVSEFIVTVIKYINHYVYDFLCTYYPKQNDAFCRNVRSYGEKKLLKNMLCNLEKVNTIEQIVKNLGVDFAYSFLLSDFETCNGSNLKQAIELPMVVAKGINDLKIEDSYSDFKKIAEINKDYAITLIEYLQHMRRVLTAKECSKEYFSTFVIYILRLMETNLYPNITTLLNYLINENFNYHDFQLPYSEAKELLDYLNIVNRVDGVEFEKYPRNIQKFLKLALMNYRIINVPRIEEFEKAVSSYSYVNDSKDENFAFFAPRSEKELYEEGQTLHHCVATWRDRIIDNGAKVVLMRKKDEIDTPFVTIEYENGVVTQVKEKYNEDVTDESILLAVSEWLKRTNQRVGKEKK